MLYITAVALAVTLVALAASIYSLQRQTRAADEELRLQADLGGQLRKALSILAILDEAESTQRAYVLTGKPDYLASYQEAVSNLPELLPELDRIADFDTGIAMKAASAKRAINSKFFELAQSIALYQAGQPDKAVELIQSELSLSTQRRAREELRSVADKIRTEREKVAAEIKKTGETRQSSVVAAAGALGIAVLLAALQTGLLLAARTRYEKDLAASEKRHRQIVEEQSELVSLALADGTLVCVNPAYGRHLGRRPQELLGCSLFDHVGPGHVEEVRSMLTRVIETGEPAHGENPMVAHGGGEMWVAWTNSVQEDDDGVRFLHSVGRDITAQKRAERALRESQDFLLKTGSLAGVGGWEVNFHTGKIYWSEQVRRIHGVDDDFEPTIDTATEFFTQEAQSALTAAVVASSDTGIPFDLELPLNSADGRLVQVRIVGEVRNGEDGRPASMSGALQDISDRKVLEAQLRESEQFVREITDNLPVRIAYLDSEGRYQFVNDAHVQRFGVPRDQILGRSRVELKRNRDAAIEERLSEALLGTPQRFVFEEVVGDQTRLIESQMVPAYSADGSIKGVYTTGSDITELKQTERRLRDLTDILEITPDMVVQTDKTGEIQYMNPAARSRVGLALDAPVKGRNFAEFNTEHTNMLFDIEILPAIKREGAWTGETTVVVDKGEVVPVSHMVIGHRDGQGRIARFSAVMRDISRAVQSRKELARQTATLISVVETIPAVVAVVGTDFRYRLANRQFEAWQQCTRERIVGRTVEEVIGAEQFQHSLPIANRAFAGETVQYEKTIPREGQPRHVSISYIPLRLEDGTVDGLVMVAQDITLHKLEAERLLDLSERDVLTGLLNRSGLNTYLNCRKAGGEAIGVIYVDLDYFKPVNDTYGHAAGDEVLRQFAQRLRGLVRPTDAVARLGGDEFVIVLAGLPDEAPAVALSRKVSEAAALPFHLGTGTVTIGASAGVAFGSPMQAWEQMLEQADAALYAEKGNRRR